MRLAIGVLCVSFGIVAVAEASPQRSQMAAQRLTYWRCLANEVVAMLPAKISNEEFAAYVKGKCLAEAGRFRSALISYFAKAMPSKATAEHVASAELAISTTQEDAVSVYGGWNR
jgi:hypothetical protein